MNFISFDKILEEHSNYRVRGTTINKNSYSHVNEYMIHFNTFNIPSRNLLRKGYSLAAVHVSVYVCTFSLLARFIENPYTIVSQTSYTFLAW